MIRQQRKQATVEAVLKRGHKNSAGECAVRIRVTFTKIQRFYPVRIDGKALYLSVADFDAIYSPKKERDNVEVADQIRTHSDKQLKPIREAIESVKSAAVVARDSINPFTFDRFEKEFLHSESSKGFLELFERYLSDLRTQGRIGTYKAYKNALEAFRSFRRGKDLSPSDITSGVLREFELYMSQPRIVPNRKKPLKAGKNTVAMYQRALKVIFNVAATDNPHLKENYPFATKQNDRGKYKIKTTAGKKADALSAEDIQLFINTDPIPHSPEWIAKHIWLFSFHGQGMNFRDIALLKYQDVGFDAIRYIRHKTKDSENNAERMEVPLSDPLRQIILTLGSADKRPGSYVFEMLTPGLDPQKQDDAIRQGIKTTNKWLKRLCEEFELTPITTYTARHSYANLMKQAGESVELIRELLGHSDIRTTESYLKRFDLSRKAKVNDKVLSIFKAS